MREETLVFCLDRASGGIVLAVIAGWSLRERNVERPWMTLGGLSMAIGLGRSAGVAAMSAPEPMTTDGASLAIFREAPSLDGARTAALGAFACESAEAGARLIREAMAKLKAEGFGAVLGPMDGNTWGKHRLVVESDGRPPFLMEPAQPAALCRGVRAIGAEDRVALCLGRAAGGYSAEWIAAAGGHPPARFRSGAGGGGADAHSCAVAGGVRVEPFLHADRRGGFPRQLSARC